MKGLGKLQLKQRRTTENRIKTLLKRKEVILTVSEIIKITKKDPTAIIRAINRLVKDEELIEYRHKNKRLVGWPTRYNMLLVKNFRIQDERFRRSQAQRDIIIEKLAGKMPIRLKKLEKKLAKYEPDTDRLYKIAVKSLDEGVIATAWDYIGKERMRLMLESGDDEKAWQRIKELSKKDKILLERLQRDDIVSISD